MAVPARTGGHEDRLGVHGEVHQRAALEVEDRLALIAVLPVLPASIVGPLARKRVLQLRRDDGNPVQTERDIYGVLRARRVVNLAGEPQAVGRVSGYPARGSARAPP